MAWESVLSVEGCALAPGGLPFVYMQASRLSQAAGFTYYVILMHCQLLPSRGFLRLDWDAVDHERSRAQLFWCTGNMEGYVKPVIYMTRTNKYRHQAT